MTQAEAKHEDHHVVPARVLLTTFAGLVMLTLLTVAAAGTQLGRWEIWISLGIAALKGSLVAAYFMHLRYDKPLHAIILITSLVFLALFLGFALMDTAEYQSDVFDLENGP